MKKTLKITLAALLCALMAVSALGCSLVSVNEDKDMAQIIAKIGDKELTKAEYLAELNYTIQMYSMYGMDLRSSPSDLEMVKDSIYENMIQYEVQVYKAKELGFATLTDEEKAEISTQVETEDNEIYESAKTAADTRVAEDPALNLEAEIEAQYKALTMQYINESLNREEMKAWLQDYFTNQHAAEKLMDSIYDQVSVTDEEVRAAYDTKLAEDKAAMAETPTSYKEAQENFERYGGTAPTVVPTGYKRIKVIQITPEGALDASYTEKEGQLAVLEAELGQLTLKNDPNDTTRIDAIKAEHAALKTELDALLTAYLADSRKAADEAYAKLQASTSFDTVMKEYTKDADFVDYPIFAEKGKLMYHDTEVADMPDVVKQAFQALTIGAYTGILEDDTGLYIVQYVGDEPAGERPYADFEESLRADTLATKQSEEWSKVLEEWAKDESIVKRFPDVLKDIVI